MAKISWLQQQSTEIHKKVEMQYARAKEAQRDWKKAKEIEVLFNEILLYFKTPSPIPSSDIAKDLQMLGFLPGELFVYTDSSKTASQLGFDFEKDLEILFQRLYQTTESMVVGGQKAYTSLTLLGQDLEKIPVRAVDVWSDETNKWVKHHYGHNQSINQNSLVRQAGVYGKVDLSIPSSTVAISYDYSDKLKRFLHLLKGANITAKCYTHMTSISFGKANYFRSLSSVLSELGYSRDYILAYYNSSQKVRYNSISGAHKAHIRFAYEVLGIGQYVDVNGTLQPFGTTRFLVVFDKTTQTVKVQSTLYLVNQYLQRTAGTKTYVANLI